MKTTESVRQFILVNAWAVSIDLTDAYTFQFIHKQRGTSASLSASGLPIHGITFRDVPKSVYFHQIDGRNRCSSASTCHLSFSVPRRLADKRSYMRQTNILHNTLSPNGTKSRIHSKSKESSSAIHLYRYEIPDTTKNSQITPRSHGIPSLDNQTISNSDSSFGSNFPFSFGQTQCCSRLSSSRQTSFTPALDVSVVSVETYTSFGLSHFDHECDPISFEVVDGSQSFCLGNIHPPDPNAFFFTDASHYRWVFISN